MSLAETLGDQSRLARAVSGAANALWQTGENVRAHAFAQRGLSLVETVTDVVPLVDLGLNLGMILRNLGDYRGATAVLAKPVTVLQGALAHARLGRAQYPAVTARNILTQCLAELGEFQQASALAEERIGIVEELQQAASLLAGHEGACYLFLRQGRFHDAIPRLERSLALWHASDVVSGYRRTAGALGYAYAMTERLAEAFPLLEQAVERARRVERVNEIRFLGYLAEAYLHAGRLSEAHVAAARTLDVSRERCERGAEAWALRLLGEVALQHASSDTEPAEDYYCQAFAVAKELGMRPLQAHCHRGIGTLYLKTGHQEQAQAELSTAMAFYRAMDMTFWLPETEAALAQV